MKIILVVLFLIPTLSFSQSKKYLKERQARADTTQFSSPLEFSFIDSSSLSKSELFSKTNLWIAIGFKNLNLDVVKDSTTGKIVIPGISSAFTGSHRYNLTIDTRDNKYRLVFNDYKTKGAYDRMVPIETAESEKGMYIGINKKSYWNNEKLYLKDEAEMVYSSLKKYLEKKDDF